MLIKVKVGVKRDSQKLEVVGKDNLRASDVYTSYMDKRRVTLGSTKKDIRGLGLGEL